VNTIIRQSNLPDEAYVNLNCRLFGKKVLPGNIRYIGFCDKKTQFVDIAAIFLGCSVPFNLQNCDERENQLRLIGKSYVHGVLNAEGFIHRWSSGGGIDTMLIL